MVALFNLGALATTALLGWLYLYGAEHSFFFVYFWFDMLLHTLGGFVMGFWASAVSARLLLRPRAVLIFAVFVALVGSALWEAFEYTAGLQGGTLDTLSDFFFSVAGMLVVALPYALFRRSRV